MEIRSAELPQVVFRAMNRCREVAFQGACDVQDFCGSVLNQERAGPKISSANSDPAGMMLPPWPINGPRAESLSTTVCQFFGDHFTFACAYARATAAS